jgi:flagellar biosynthesis protein FliQ
MTTASVVDLMRVAFITTFWLSLPVLAAGFIIGLVMSLAQILTSIQDPSFSAVPRLTVFLVAYTTLLFGDLGRFAH